MPFILTHVACLGVWFTGISTVGLVLCVLNYVVRMFGITAGYHRYFSHRAFKTSRWFQFVLAGLGASCVQKGPLWWAAHHRHHHRFSDTEEDLHSPVARSIWWSHVGWVLAPDYDATNWKAIKDFSRFRELRWLNRYHLIPGLLLAVGCYLLGGWTGLFWGFFVSTVLLWHGTFTVNSLCHLFGKRRYQTTDASRNNALVALITLGEGWHNNHHHYQSCARQGFFWWEIDVSYYVLKLLSWVGLIWDIRQPPAKVLAAASQPKSTSPAPPPGG